MRVGSQSREKKRGVHEWAGKGIFKTNKQMWISEYRASKLQHRRKSDDMLMEYLKKKRREEPNDRAWLEWLKTEFPEVFAELFPVTPPDQRVIDTAWGLTEGQDANLPLGPRQSVRQLRGKSARRLSVRHLGPEWDWLMRISRERYRTHDAENSSN